MKIKNVYLSQRQKEVIRLKMQGFADKEVAAELGISYGTVRDYLDAAINKFGAINILHLVVLLIRKNLI